MKDITILDPCQLHLVHIVMKLASPVIEADAHLEVFVIGRAILTIGSAYSRMESILPGGLGEVQGGSGLNIIGGDDRFVRASLLLRDTFCAPN